MSAEHNPLIPAGYDVAWSVVTIVVVGVAIAALVVLARSAGTLVSLFVPVVGPLAWLTIGRRALAGERSS